MRMGLTSMVSCKTPWWMIVPWCGLWKLFPQGEPRNQKNRPDTFHPRCSMYGIFTYIPPIFMVNAGP